MNDRKPVIPYFNFEMSQSNKWHCNFCGRVTKVIKIQYTDTDLRSDKTGKICKRLQRHYQNIWICMDCYKRAIKKFRKQIKLEETEEE